MRRRAKVLLLIPHLGGGGAERIAVLLARGLSPRKYEVHLCLITSNGSSQEDLPSDVALHCLGAARVRNSTFGLLRLIHDLKPDLILSGMPHLNFLVLLLRPLFPWNTKVLVRQTSTPCADFKSGHWLDKTAFLYRLLYPRADRIICQTRIMAQSLGQLAGLSKTQFCVLPNPIDVEAIEACQSEIGNQWLGTGPNLLAVGRLSHEKGFDLLLRAVAALRARFPNVNLTILGEGSERQTLEHLRDTLHLNDAVRFAGRVRHPESYFVGATIFVLYSRHEGMPNAMLEAPSPGIPIVALPAAGGVAELLCDKPGVWLAPEISFPSLERSLSAALHALGPGARFTHLWIHEFRMDRAIPSYENLIDETLSDDLFIQHTWLRPAR